MPPTLTDRLRELRDAITKEMRRLKSLKNPQKSWRVEIRRAAKLEANRMLLRKVKRMLAE